MGDNTKQVRVDNWGIFFLQRLQMFFSKTDYCDMTLQFEGNVQLKVHRLVMNACTEYFQFLEQTCGLDENVIMMPADLQADVIVPIVNFMYTGMLEFHLSIYDRLYKTAQLMNITILTKLLDAQKQGGSLNKMTKKKFTEQPHSLNVPGSKKPVLQKSHHTDLPATLPGRKLPIWKRKSVPSSSKSFSHSPQVFHSEPKWRNAPPDPLSLPDNTPKPTRFEWPDDDLPSINMIDTSFDDISYTSKPLLTQEEESRASSSFDDLRQTPNSSRTTSTAAAVTGGAARKRPSNLDMEEMQNYVKEQKIRSGLQDDEDIDNDLDNSNDSTSLKRRADQKLKGAIKRVRFEEQDGKGTTISIATDSKSTGDLNHSKLVSEILKKYPQLVKTNKNIRLKIMTKNKTTGQEQLSKNETIQIRSSKVKEHLSKPTLKEPKTENSVAPWVCDRCSTDDEPMEFVLYYLFRKHMTDVHNEKFDSRLCKYCGHRCNKHNLMLYHLYTKHGMKPPPAYSFPKCSLCPYIALSINILNKHKMRHDKNEVQCVECKLTFTSRLTLNTHLQITGHNGKTAKCNYDCQYCTKKFQAGSNLFSHVKMQHRNEAIRDGMVSVDEEEEIEDSDDQDENSKEEYILPEIISEHEHPKKVNVLSNVKVAERHVQQNLTLEPSSEAEALTNVATGIATSLGLVDIVVLNENQPLFLQSDQQNYGDQQTDQAEFILPELTGRETFTHDQNEVITTDGVITQSMLSSGDIGSTDELVMVLTDHDYGDNQEDVNNDNQSNIVVLYSHPVDGQQDQFITSQGNIMVNSQTGLIEIRNGATITTPSGNPVELVQAAAPQQPETTPIESIEMIQREIESHTEEQPLVGSTQQTMNAIEQEQEIIVGTPMEADQQQPVEEVCIPTTNNEQEENMEIERNENREEQKPQVMEAQEEVEENHEDHQTEVQQLQMVEAQTDTANLELESVKETEEIPMEKVQEEVPLSKEDEDQNQTSTEQNPAAAPPMEVEESHPQLEQPVEGASEEMEVEHNEEVPPAEEISDQEKSTGDVEALESQNTLPKDNDLSATCNDIVEELVEEKQDEMTEQETSLHAEEPAQEETSETSPSQDDNSQSSQDSNRGAAKKKTSEDSAKIPRAILEDWEDTDSQHSSSQKEDPKVIRESVNKLMDDWEEEEEEDVRKEADE